MHENKRKYYTKLYEKFKKSKKEIDNGRVLSQSEKTEYEELGNMQQSIIKMLKD